jgi:hypothetical protein
MDFTVSKAYFSIMARNKDFLESNFLGFNPFKVGLLRWIGIAYGLAIIAFLIAEMILGPSAFAGGHVKDGRYFVVDHNITFDMTPGHYWLSYWIGLFTLISGLAWCGGILIYGIKKRRDRENAISENANLGP